MEIRRRSVSIVSVEYVMTIYLQVMNIMGHIFNKIIPKKLQFIHDTIQRKAETVRFCFYISP